MQAVCIIAHRDIEQVIHLTDILLDKFIIYIHFDKKLVLKNTDINRLKQRGIIWFQEVKVCWGGWSIGAAVQVLMREALKNPDITYIHIISGQCWPTKSINEIYEFYENKDDIFMTYAEASEITKRGENLLNWMKFYFPFDYINRKKLFGKILHRLIYVSQTILRVDKLKKYHFDLTIYTGAVWMDLPMDTVKYIINYFDSHKNVQKVFMTGFCPDEFVCQTILLNSYFKDRIVNDNHRFIKWEEKYGSYPAVLDEGDYKKIVEGDYHFMRKINEKISKELLKLFLK